MTDLAKSKPQTFLFFEAGTPWTLAAVTFRRKYGLAPENVFENKGRVWAGPVPEKGDVASRPSC